MKQMEEERKKENEIDFDHDLALSFAGENRDTVESIAIELRNNDVNVFYDDFYKAELVGKDLSDYFKKKYSDSSKYVVIFISKYYTQKDWTNFEFEIALDKTKTMKTEFILPVRLDDTIVLGMKRTIGYIHHHQNYRSQFSPINVFDVHICNVKSILFSNALVIYAILRSSQRILFLIFLFSLYLLEI